MLQLPTRHTPDGDRLAEPGRNAINDCAGTPFGALPTELSRRRLESEVRIATRVGVQSAAAPRQRFDAVTQSVSPTCRDMLRANSWAPNGCRRTTDRREGEDEQAAIRQQANKSKQRQSSQNRSGLTVGRHQYSEERRLPERRRRPPYWGRAVVPRRQSCRV